MLTSFRKRVFYSLDTDIMITVTKSYCVDKRKLILPDKPRLWGLFVTITEHVFPGAVDSPSPVYLFEHILSVLLSCLG